MQSISPETIFRGNGAWEKALPQIVNLTKSPLILGRNVHTNDIKNKIFRDLENQDLSVNSAYLQFDCCDEDISRVRNIILNNNHDAVIAAGGGKVLDSGKYIAEILNIPCITVPVSASTCAGWTAVHPAHVDALTGTVMQGILRISAIYLPESRTLPPPAAITAS